MNKYSEALLQAFRITAQSEVNKFKYDKTVQSKILSVVDISKGEYEVEYQNNRITAYSLDLEKTYKKDENILIKIPEGDLSNKIVIEGRVSAMNINSLTLNKLRNSFYPVGQSFFNSNKILKLKAFTEKEKQDTTGEVKLDKEFELNVTECEYLQIKAEFQTRFFGKHSTGNYGLIINFLTKDNSIYTVILNSSDFIGDFYNFHQWTEQSKIISIPKNLISKISSIYFVCENFKIDDESENSKDENLLCRNIKIGFMNKVDLLDGGYYLYLQTPQGKFFNDDTSSLEIVANLLVNGENITNQSGCELKWEKLYLTESNSWQKLENAGNSYTVKKEEVGDYSATYRVTASYKDIITSQEIVIYGIKYLEAPKIIQTMDNKDVKLSLSTNEEGDWFCLLSNGEYKRIDKGKKQFITLKKEDLLYDNMKIYCQIDNYVTSIVLSKPQTIEDVTASFVGQDVYKYDANGAITQEDSEMKRTLNFNAIFKEGIAYNYSIKWYLGDIELSENVTSPDNSMLSKILVDKSGILFYNIRQKYERERINNTIRVELTATNNKTYTFEKTIIFTKDGDQGTNGTSYVLRVFPIDNDGKEISKLWGLNSNSTGRLKAKLLKNGKDIEETDISFSWENVAPNSIVSSEKNSSIIEVKSNENKECIVQVTARCQGMSISNVYGVNVLTSGSILDYNISSIPNVIRYNSDGGNPSVNSGSYEYTYQENTDPAYVNITVPTNIFALEKKYQIVIINKSLYHPIIYHTNRYGNEAINSWDGTTIETKNGTIIAPQIGAGTKDSDNSFTGFIIGKNTGNNNKVGLYGYSKGEQTFLLDENGKAKFGKNDQHAIIIDGSKAVINGGNMTINLNGSNNDIAIKAGDNFQVDYNGKLIASSANITGRITATSGKIGKWEIDENGSLKNESTTLTSDGKIDTVEITINNGSTGRFGEITGNDGEGTTQCIGINSIQKSIVLLSGRNIRFSTGLGGQIYINKQTLESYIQDIVRQMISTTGE